MTTTEGRLSMSLGEAIFSQRAIRRVRPDPIPEEDLQHILEAAIHAPNGGNQQPWRFIVLRDPEVKAKFATLYEEAWWAKRKDEGINGPQDIAPGKGSQQSAMRLSKEIGQAPVIVLSVRHALGGWSRWLHYPGRSEPASCRPRCGRGRHHHHASRCGGRACAGAVRRARHWANRICPAAGLPQGQLRVYRP